MAVQRVAVAADAAAGAVDLTVAATSGAAQESVAASGREVAQLLDINMDQRSGLGVLVAADRLAGGPIQVTEAADATADQDRVHGRSGQPDPSSDLDRPESLGPAQVHDPTHHWRRVRQGEWCGRLDRSAIPAGPWTR